MELFFVDIRHRFLNPSNFLWTNFSHVSLFRHVLQNWTRNSRRWIVSSLSGSWPFIRNDCIRVNGFSSMFMTHVMTDESHFGLLWQPSSRSAFGRSLRKCFLPRQWQTMTFRLWHDTFLTENTVQIRRNPFLHAFLITYSRLVYFRFLQTIFFSKKPLLRMHDRKVRILNHLWEQRGVL